MKPECQSQSVNFAPLICVLIMQLLVRLPSTQSAQELLNHLHMATLAVAAIKPGTVSGRPTKGVPE
jgi:hypothetical protein